MLEQEKQADAQAGLLTSLLCMHTGKGELIFLFLCLKNKQKKSPGTSLLLSYHRLPAKSDVKSQLKQGRQGTELPQRGATGVSVALTQP